MKLILQNVIVELGYNELGNAKFSDIVRAGAEKLEELIDNDIVTLSDEGNTTYVIIDDLYQLPSKQPTYQDYPKVIKDNKLFSDLGERTKVEPVVKPTYLFEQSKQPKSVELILNKLGAIPFRIMGYALDFERTNKTGCYDENFLIESEAMRQSVSENINKVLYLGWQYDKRGRIYSDGKLLNFQSDEWNKASFQPIVKAEKVSDEGIRQLKLYLTAQYGLDKLTYDKRLEYINNNLLDGIKPKKPILAKVAEDMLNSLDYSGANPTLDMTVGIDATASGYQIFAILANCEDTAKLTNLTDSSNCYDIYGEACKRILELTGSEKSVKDIRDIVKKALMTRGYNSDKQVEVAKKELKRLKIDISLNELKDILDLSPKVKKCKEAINNLLLDTFSNLPDNEQIIRWRMPDGFIVELANIQKKMFKYKGKHFSTWIKYDALGWNKELNWRALSPSLIHSIDAYICREMIRRCNFQIVTIHDCFYCHPNNVLEMRKQYIKLLKEIQSMNMLEYICKQINPSFEWKIDEKLFEISDDENSYCLC